MRAARVDWEDQRRRKVVKKILPKESQPGGLSPCLGPSWLAVKGAWLASRALAQATERLAGLDPAVVGGER